jgi:hypothetical protein
MANPNRLLHGSLVYRALAATLLTIVIASPAAAQSSPVILFTSTEQIPLKTYAELMRTGVLRMSFGSMKDIPVIEDFQMIRCALTGWVPGRAVVASEELFSNERAERRLLPIATRRVGVSALTVRIADLESPQKIDELLTSVGVREGTGTGYFFFTLAGDGIVRYYPFQFKTRGRQEKPAASTAATPR